MNEKACAATPHDELIQQLMDSRIPKTEREHAASREIEKLRAELQNSQNKLKKSGRAKLRTERDALKEKVEQYEEDHRRVIAEKCPTDEIHCSCVPHLRQELEDEHCRYRSAYEDCIDKDNEIERLRAELASWQKAFGLLTTLHGSMPIDISDPLRMAKSIEGHVRAELEASETELRIVRASQAESNAEVERLRAELAECRRDAERYRAIKKGVSLYIPNPDCYDFDYVLPSDLDAMADAALAAKGEE